MDWKDTEKIAAILEKFITPDSTVEHNKYLPVIGRPERVERQCDVVITFGKGIRKTIAIVEVQDRVEKPDIGTFHGWILKKDEVGAQQLICVSKAGYPQSIIDDVKNKYGNSVILMTLEEFDYLNDPQKFNMLPFNIILNPNYKFLEVGKLKLDYPKNVEHKLKEIEILITEKDKVFSFGENGKKENVFDLIFGFVDSKVDLLKLNRLNIKEGVVDLEVNSTHNIYYHYNNKSVRIAKWLLKIKLEIKKTLNKTTVKQYKYRQEFVDGAIAWIASTTVLINGAEKNIDIVFQTSNGFLFINAVTHN